MAVTSKYWRLDLGMQPGQTDGDQLSGLAFFDGNGTAIDLTGATVTASSTGNASNAILNSVFSGAAVGTFPAGWAPQQGNGVSVAIVGTGVEDGINYVDIHFSGTSNSTGTLARFTPSPSVQLPVSGGASVVGSAYMRMVAGSTSNITDIFLEVDQSNSSGAFINSHTTSLLSGLSAPGIGSNRVSSALSKNVNAANFFGGNLDLSVVTGAAVDITLRYGGVQLEYGTAPSAYVPTPTSGVSGAPSVLTDGNTTTWWYPGTLAAGGTASLYLTFPAAVDVGSIQYTQGNSLFKGPASTAIYTSTDGSTWARVASANFAAWSGTTPQSVSLTNARVSQASLQAIGVGTPNARVSQASLQAIGVGTPNARVSQVSLQVLWFYPGSTAEADGAGDAVGVGQSIATATGTASGNGDALGKSVQVTPTYKAPLAIKAADFLQMFLNLLPRGSVWPKEPDSVMSRALFGLMPTYERSTNAANNLLVDAFPLTTVQLLPEWEATLGLPDPCAGESPLISQRQGQVVARLTARGNNQSAAFYTKFAANLGYDIGIETYAPFAADRGRAEDPVYGEDWAFAWTVTNSNLVVTYFAAEDAAEEPLATWDNSALICELQRLAPAHTFLNFAS